MKTKAQAEQEYTLEILESIRRIKEIRKAMKFIDKDYHWKTWDIINRQEQAALQEFKDLKERIDTEVLMNDPDWCGF